LSRQFGGRHVEFLKLVGKMFTGMNRGRAICVSSVIINNFNICWTRGPFWPFEANPPLIIDTDVKLTLAGAMERGLIGPAQEDPTQRTAAPSWRQA
jgi:hypothetical protein